MTMPSNLETATEALQPANGIYATYSEGKPTGFYFEAVHGARMMSVERLVVSDDIRVRHRVAYDMVPNPDCKIPEDAVPITREEHRRLLDEMFPETPDG
jgi:hypothetical protein